MIALDTIRSVFIWHCLNPDLDPTTPNWQKYLRIFHGVALPLNFICCMIGSARYCYNHFEANVEEALFALFPFIYGVYLTYGYIALLSVRREITMAFAEFQEIYDEYDEDESFKSLLTKVNEKCTKITKIFVILIPLGQIMPPIFLAVVSVISSFVKYRSAKVDELYIPYKYALPWDQSTFIGWIYDSIYCAITATPYYTANGCFISFFLSITEHHVAFYQQFDTYIMRIERIAENYQLAKQGLGQLVRFHVQIKDLFRRTIEVYSVFILVMMLCSILHASLILYLFDLALQNNPATIYVCMGILALNLSTLFIYCYYGNKSTEVYLRMANRLHESNWRVLPLDLQKYFMLLIQSTQKPLRYHGFGIAYLNLETFLKVCRTIVSYYLMIKTLTTQ